ncbi:SIR2-like domain-containing protein [Xylariomycetidae sp. FL2044]|nr:SIR2-like domain-containing protein [Xylariomycetidae sp. FL2044]
MSSAGSVSSATLPITAGVISISSSSPSPPLPPPPPPPPPPAPQPDPEPEPAAQTADEQRQEREQARTQRGYVRTLQQELARGRLAICVGSGSTVYSCLQECDRLSWGGLIRNGLDYFELQAGALVDSGGNKHDIAQINHLLQGDSLQDGLDACTRLQRLLDQRPDLYAGWLKNEFRDLYEDHMTNPDILDALKRLHHNGVALFTTNYDDLLEKHCHMRAVDTTQPQGLIDFRRGCKLVFHPHGIWKNPEGVVLSTGDYYNVKRDSVVQETLSHLFETRTVLFVGCGGGLKDPNYGPLLEYDDIPRFLNDLLPHDTTINNMLLSDERRQLEEWLSPMDQSTFLRDALAMHQGNSEVAKVIHKNKSVWNNSGGSLVWVTGPSGCGKTLFSATLIDKTMQECRKETADRARDSLAYFFCATTDPALTAAQQAELRTNLSFDFNMFLRTAIAQLLPVDPDPSWTPVRNLYSATTDFRPARKPTNAELRRALIEMLGHLGQPYSKTGTGGGAGATAGGGGGGGGLTQPGETYIVLDNLDWIPNGWRSEFLGFVAEVEQLALPRLHFCVGGQDRRDMEHAGVRGAEWKRVEVNKQTVMRALRKYLGFVFDNDPQLRGLSKAQIKDVANRLKRSDDCSRAIYNKILLLQALETLDQDSIDQIVPPLPPALPGAAALAAQLGKRAGGSISIGGGGVEGSSRRTKKARKS